MVRIALVGYGYWGPNLARNLHGLPDGDFVWCCDSDSSRLRTAQALYPYVQVTSHVEEIWKDPRVDAAVIATPIETHFSLAKAALSAGKHLLVEKPLTLKSQEALELIDLAKSSGRVLMVGHTYEYNPAVLAIKKLIEAGELGDVYYGYSRRVNLGQVRKKLNVLWNIAPHDISIYNFLFDAMPSEVSARGAAFLNAGVEDVAFVDLRFPSGAVAHIHASWLDPSKVRTMTLVGSKKMVYYDDLESEGKVKVYDKGVLKVGAGEIYGEFQYRLHSGDIHIPRIDMVEPLRNECAHFVECVRTGRKPRTDGENGLRVVRVLEAAQLSLEKRGAPVEVSL